MRKTGLIIIGILASVILLELGLRTGGFIFTYMQELRNGEELDKRGVYRILCLGESTTQMTYPKYLEMDLNRRDIGTKFSVIDKGRTGINSNYIVEKLEENIDKYKPDMVITMMGINDGRTDIVFEKDERTLKVYKLAMLLKPHVENKINPATWNPPSPDGGGMRSSAMADPREGDWFKEPRTRGVATGSKDGSNSSFKLYELVRSLRSYMTDKMDALRQTAAIIRIKIKGNSKSAPTKILGDEMKYVGQGHFYRDRKEFEKAVEMYKKAIDINPKYDQGYLGVGDCYRNTGRYEDAEIMYRKAIKVNPGAAFNYVELGHCLRDQQRYEEAERIYKKAIAIDPVSEQGHFGLGDCYSMVGRYGEAEDLYKKAIEINPKNEIRYSYLGAWYRFEKKFVLAEDTYKKAIKQNPNSEIGYTGLADLFIDMSKYKDAEGPAKRALEINRKNPKAYLNLAKIYVNLKKDLELKQLINTAVTTDVKDERDYKELFELAKKYAGKEVIKKYSDKIGKFETGSYYLETKINYNKVAGILKKRGVKHVAVQYPLRKLSLLKKMLEPNGNIVFVDNEESFKQGVAKEGYRVFFFDRFGGDFGHCTPKGNKLLAKDIADTITKEVFNTTKR